MQYFQLFMKGRLADAWNRRMDVCFQSLHKPNGHISFYLEFQLEDKTISFEISYFAPCLYIWNLSSQIQMESKMYYLADGIQILSQWVTYEKEEWALGKEVDLLVKMNLLSFIFIDVTGSHFLEQNSGRNSTKKNMAMNMNAIIHRFWFSKEEMYTITLEILESIHWRKNWQQKFWQRCEDNLEIPSPSANIRLH